MPIRRNAELHGPGDAPRSRPAAISRSAAALDLAAAPARQQMQYLRARRHAADRNSLALVFGLPNALPKELGRSVMLQILQAEHRDARRFPADRMPSIDELRTLARHLPPGGQAEAHAELRELASRMSTDEERADAFEILANRLPDDNAPGAHRDLRRRAERLNDDSQPALVGAWIDELLQDFYSPSRSEQPSEKPRERAIGALARNLPQGDAPFAHADLRRMTEKLRNENSRILPLRSLAAKLPQGDEADAHGDLRRICERLESSLDREQIVLVLAKHLPDGDEAAATAELRRIAATCRLPDQSERLFEALDAARTANERSIDG